MIEMGVTITETPTILRGLIDYFHFLSLFALSFQKISQLEILYDISRININFVDEEISRILIIKINN